METAMNFETVISAITALDVLISGDSKTSSYKHGKVVSSLFNYILNDKLDKNFSKYIYDSFKLFTIKKQYIHINLWHLDKYNEKDDGKLVNLIVHKLKAFDRSETCKMNMDNTNILTPQLLSIFPNLCYVQITASNIDGDKNYIFSLYELLSSIKNTKVNTVRIQSRNWVTKLWDSSSEMLVMGFEKQNFNIRMRYDDLTITRN